MPDFDAPKPAVKPEVGGVFSWFLGAGGSAASAVLCAKRQDAPADLRALLACWEQLDPSPVARVKEQSPGLPGRRPVVQVELVDGAPEDRVMHAREAS